MNDVFGFTYSDVYDFIYHDKDYGFECDLIEGLFKLHGDGQIRKVLDLGCGTGNHAIPLAQRGYEVVGVDRSESMLAKAREKVGRDVKGLRVLFQQGDIRNANVQGTFDAVLMMFTVLGYQLNNEDVIAALRTARQHLRPGGLLILDVWYGPAVLHHRPSHRMKLIRTLRGQILRMASGELDTRRHFCTVRYHLWQLEGERLVAETEESHRVRYFFPMELALFLESAGFSLLRLGAFPEIDHDPDEETWNVIGVAKAFE